MATSTGPEITSDIELKPISEDVLPEAYQPLELEESGAEPLKVETDEAMAAFGEDIQKLRSVNESYLKGEISGDVAERLRAHSAETAMAGGISTESPAARSLQARDFGLTSIEMQQAGIETGTRIAALQENLTKLSEDRYKFQESLFLDRQKVEEQSGQFASTYGIDTARTIIADNELRLKQDTFSKEYNFKMYELVAGLVSSQANLQVQAATSGKSFDMTPINNALNSMITDLNNVLKRSN
jgi:NAD kinase